MLFKFWTESLPFSYLALKHFPRASNPLSSLNVFLPSSTKKDKIKRPRKGNKLTKECDLQPDLWARPLQASVFPSIND